MTEPTAAFPPAGAPVVCYRHQGVAAAVTCAHCGRPICPDCMVDAPVGFQCPACVHAAAAAAPRAAATAVSTPWRAGTRRSGVSVTVVLIGLNLVAFLLSFTNLDDTVLRFALQWNSVDVNNLGRGVLVGGVEQGEWWRLVTSMFLHGGIAHVAFNMFALYVFGTQLEGILGRWWFLALYFVSGIVGGAVFLALSQPFGVPAVGASGAIFGLFGAMIALIIPRRHTQAGRAMFQQMVGLLVINLLMTFAIAGIAWQAHVGGLVSGFLIAWVMDRSEKPVVRLAPVAACLLATLAVLVTGPVA